jgi:hypothetical protein
MVFREHVQSRLPTAHRWGRKLSYPYAAASNRTRITWPDTGANALYVAYVYDVLNRVTQIEENGATSGAGLLASYAYDSLGRRSSVARAGGSGAATAYGYDGASRLYTLAQTLAGSASVTCTLGYNAANQIVTRQVSNSADVANPGPITAGYTANGLNQYTAVTGITASYVAANQATLTYDPTGALQTETTAGATTTLLYDGANLMGEYSSSGAILHRAGYANAPPSRSDANGVTTVADLIFTVHGHSTAAQETHSATPVSELVIIANKPNIVSCSFSRQGVTNSVGLGLDLAGFGLSFAPGARLAVAGAGLALSAVAGAFAGANHQAAPGVFAIVGYHVAAAGPVASQLENSALTATGRQLAGYLPVAGQIIAGSALAYDAVGTYNDLQRCLAGH